jgi:hypothetical protein
MLTITEYSVELVKDAFGILAGQRYEFLLELELDEEDELYSPKGIYIRAIYKVDGDEQTVVNYQLLERETNRHLDFGLEDEEEAELASFCREHWSQES